MVRAAPTDLDADGKDEIVLQWGRDGLSPTHWWITDGRTDLLTVTTVTASQE
jgi:hypothetical protein